VPLQALAQLLLLEAVQMGVALRKALDQACQPFCISPQPHSSTGKADSSQPYQRGQFLL
jgi:hypothetical protein